MLIWNSWYKMVTVLYLHITKKSRLVWPTFIGHYILGWVNVTCNTVCTVFRFPGISSRDRNIHVNLCQVMLSKQRTSEGVTVLVMDITFMDTGILRDVQKCVLLLLLLLLLLLSMLHISRSKDLWKITSSLSSYDKTVVSTFFIFSFQYFLLLLKSSRSCVFFLLLSLHKKKSVLML